jgi:hypothetical protein
MQLRRRRCVRASIVRSVTEALESRRMLSANPGTEDGQIYDYGPAGVGTDFQLNTRWSSTANGSTGATGTGITLTYSIVPDGTTMVAGQGEPNAPSDLRARLNAIYPGGQSQWLPVIQQVFAEWSAISGITYVYEPNDDGVGLTTAAGVLGVRGDVRIGAHVIDGASGILAYNYFPNNSDMTIDSADLGAGGYMSDTSNNSQKLRNVMAHEHGHGLGFSHVDPTNQTKLMEAFVSTAYDGPQYDDMSAVQRNYGDFFEKGAGNNTAANATNRGTLSATDTISNVSLSTTSDLDFSKVNIAQKFFIKLTPFGATYQQGPQNGATSNYNGSSQMDLQLQLLASDGTTVLQTANATGVGGSEQIIVSSPGTYYIKVMPAPGASNSVQTYNLSTVIGVPAIPSTPDLTTASDTGLSTTDNITKNNTPTFSGTAAAGATITLFADGNQVGTGTADAGGNWSVKSSLLTDGQHVMTATASNPNGSSSASSPLTITIDTVIPNAPSRPDMTAITDQGKSNTDNITNVTNPQFVGTGEIGARLQLIVDSSNSGQTTVNGSGNWSLISLPITNGTHTMTATATDTAGNVSSASAGLSIRIDAVAPTVTTAAFNFQTAHTLDYTFSEDVGWSVDETAVTIDNLSNSTTLDNSTFGFSYSTGTNSVSYSFPGQPAGLLADANYRSTLTGVRDVAGNFLAADKVDTFFVLTGDANHDRSVDLTDFTILASNFNQSAKIYGDGNFDYDAGGNVDLTDFTLLAAHFNQTLSPAPAASLAVAASPPKPAASDQATQMTPVLSSLNDEQPLDVLPA